MAKRAADAEPATSPWLPLDVVHTIVSHACPEALMRMRHVCRDWRDIVDRVDGDVWLRAIGAHRLLHPTARDFVTPTAKEACAMFHAAVVTAYSHTRHLILVCGGDGPALLDAATGVDEPRLRSIHDGTRCAHAVPRWLISALGVATVPGHGTIRRFGAPPSLSAMLAEPGQLAADDRTLRACAHFVHACAPHPAGASTPSGDAPVGDDVCKILWGDLCRWLRQFGFDVRRWLAPISGDRLRAMHFAGTDTPWARMARTIANVQCNDVENVAQGLYAMAVDSTGKASRIQQAAIAWMMTVDSTDWRHFSAPPTGGNAPDDDAAKRSDEATLKLKRAVDQLARMSAAYRLTMPDAYVLIDQQNVPVVDRRHDSASVAMSMTRDALERLARLAELVHANKFGECHAELDAVVQWLRACTRRMMSQITAPSPAAIFLQSGGAPLISLGNGPAHGPLAMQWLQRVADVRKRPVVLPDVAPV